MLLAHRGKRKRENKELALEMRRDESLWRSGKDKKGRI